jgi:pimeloyl-ACP methyl ester carboxylesterase
MRIPPAIQANKQTTQINHKKGSFTSGLKWAGIVLGSLAVLGAIYQEYATKTDLRSYPPPGRLVDVGGYHIHLLAMGQEHSGPTVILDAGLGIPAVYMSRLQAEIASFARVVTYDRPGSGWSDDPPAGQSRDAANTARALHMALTNAAIPGPYVLVGHSMGGLNVLVFGGAYRDEVAGMVLVDSSHPEQFQRYGPDHAKEKENTLWLARGMSLAAHLGILRLVNGVATFQAQSLAPREQAELQMFFASPRLWDSVIAEMNAWQSSSIGEVKQVQLGDMPLVVITAGETAKSIPIQVQLHDELARYSTNSARRQVEGASHGNIVILYTAELTAAIQEVIKAAETGSRLNQ